MSSVLVTTVNE